MNKYSGTVLLSLFFTFATAQTTLQGNIGGSLQQKTLLYVYLLNDIYSVTNPVDSFEVSAKGYFKGRIKKTYPEGSLFKAALVQDGQMINPLKDDLLDNTFLFTNEKGVIKIAANADTALYRATITTQSPANKEIIALQKHKIPVYELMYWYAANRPVNKDELPEYAMTFSKFFLPVIELYRKKLLNELSVKRSGPAITACLYQLMQSALSSSDSVIVHKHIKGKPFPSTNLAVYLLSHYSQYNDNIGKQVGDIMVADTKGNKKKIAEIMSATADSLWIIDCWASWCGACREVNTMYLPRMVDTLKNKKIQLLSISVDEKVEKWQKAVLIDNCNWPQYMDNKKRELYNRLSIQGLPYYLVVNKKGHVVFTTGSKVHLMNFIYKSH